MTSISNPIGSLNSAKGKTIACLENQNTFTKAQAVTPVTLTVGATTPTDASLGNVFKVSLTQTTTLSNPTNLVAGGYYTWIIYQNAVTAYTVALDTVFSPLGDALVVDPTLNSISVLEGTYDGTNIYYSFVNKGSITLQNHVFVAENGVNTPGGGSLTAPFADPFYATTQISGTLSNPQVIDISAGSYSSGSALLLKPNISYLGTVQSILNPSTYSLDSSWSSAASGSSVAFTDLDILSTFNINFSSITTTSLLEFYNCVCSSAQVILGHSDTTTFYIAEGTNFQSSVGIDSSNTYMEGCNINSGLTASASTATSTFYAYACNFLNNQVFDGSHTNTVTIRNSVIAGQITIDGTFTHLTIDATSYPGSGFVFTGGASFASNVTVVPLSVNSFNNGASASSSTFLRGDGTWVAPSVMFPNGTVTVTGATQAITAGTSYIANNGSGPVTFTTIPAGTTGQYFQIAGSNTNGWVLDVGNTQTVKIGNTTAATNGTDAWNSNLGFETVTFYCTSPNNWEAIAFSGLPYCNNGNPLPTNLITTNTVATSSVTAIGDNAYWINNGASLVTLTLDSSFNFFTSSTEIHVFGNSSGGWKIQYGTGWKIIFGSQSSTVTTGYLQSTTQYDYVKLKYIGSSTWQVISYGGMPKFDTGNLAPSANFTTISQSSPSVFYSELSANHSTTSTTGTMTGFGSTYTYTPSKTGKIKVTLTGALQNDSAVASACQLRYGTGTAPISGASPTGTAVGNQITVSATDANVADLVFPVTISVYITGLTLSTAYWFDIDLLSVSAGTAHFYTITFLIEEY